MSESSSASRERPSWKSTVQVAALSDIGMRRAINQDSLCVMPAESQAAWQRHGHLFLVADGMGAHAAGELASKLATDLIPLNYSKYCDVAPAEALHRSISDTNAEIFRRGQANYEFRNMGTTCSALVLLPEGAVVAHVGDSRVYQLSGDRLYQLTFDHSLVWEMQAAGRLSEDAVRSGIIPKNVITRSLGPNALVKIDLEGPFPIRRGDRFLLCSDGLSGQISDAEIASLLQLLPPAKAAQLFVDLSNLRGGPDNITAVVVEVVDESIATRGSDSIALRRDRHRQPFSKALGLVAAICLLAAVALALIGQIPLAVVTSLLGVIAIVTGLAQILWSGGQDEQLAGRYGAGPHRQLVARATPVLFEQLAETMKPLREAAMENDWHIDWQDLDRQFATACQAADAKDYVTAIRAQANVIVDFMQQIRQQRGGNASDTLDR